MLKTLIDVLFYAFLAAGASAGLVVFIGILIAVLMSDREKKQEGELEDKDIRK